MNTAHETTSDSPSTPERIDLYWRPGCGFCSSLRRGLDKVGLERVEHNIWDDPNGAATVRRYANGNETVPTVVIGDQGLVNPSAKQLLAFLASQAPHLLPSGHDVADDSGGKVGRFVGRVLGS
jgi:mycoredoxin